MPFKKSIFSFIRFIKVPPKSVYQHLYFNGIFTVKINADKKFRIMHLGFVEENEIFWEGIYNGWEKKSVSLWIELCKDCKTVFDIGANTGLYALVAKTMNPTARVFAFEPIPQVFNALVQNRKINNFDIKNYQIGLSDYDGTAKIYLPKNMDFSYSVTVNQNTLGNQEVNELEIKVMKLSSFIKSENIGAVDLMKIDVETHEVEVLRGMGEYLHKFKPTLIIEILGEKIAENLNEIFIGSDYLFFNINDVKNTIRQTSKIEKSDHWNYLICNKQIAQKLNLL